MVNKISDNIDFYHGDAIDLKITTKFRMIYFDPPFNSDRDYKLCHDSNIGFSDKWSDSDYYDFISVHIYKLY